jgi:hypothetical protein
MDTFGVATVLVVVIILTALMFGQLQDTFPVVRGRLAATWPMYPGAKEGFKDGDAATDESNPMQGINSPELKKWLPAPEKLTAASKDCPQTLYDAAGYEAGIGKPFKSYDLLSGWLPGFKEPRVAFGPTSQDCYKVDWARGLERAGSYAQRTNNYQHGYPDSCSAPNHDLILDYYVWKPSGPPYQV